MTEALKGKPKNLTWSSEINQSFQAAKQAIMDIVPLAHPDPTAALSLATDASATHIGGVLQQQTNLGPKPLAFFSKKLNPTQLKYSTFDRELLAVFLSIRHFRFMLEGRSFTLLTDHKPIISALKRVSAPWSARQQRQLSYIAEFTSDVQYTPGAANAVADALSRPENCKTVPISSTATPASPFAPPTPPNYPPHPPISQYQTLILE